MHGTKIRRGRESINITLGRYQRFQLFSLSPLCYVNLITPRPVCIDNRHIDTAVAAPSSRATALLVLVGRFGVVKYGGRNEQWIILYKQTATDLLSSTKAGWSLAAGCGIMSVDIRF